MGGKGIEEWQCSITALGTPEFEGLTADRIQEYLVLPSFSLVSLDSGRTSRFYLQHDYISTFHTLDFKQF